VKKTWIKVFASLTIIFMLFSLAGASAAEAWGSDPNPVIFVHGYFDKSSEMEMFGAFDDLKNHLDHQGWDRDELFIIQYSNVIGCNINNAHELAGHVNNVKNITGSDEVDIVAHSMGGLSTRYYMQNMGGHHHVGSVITLGTPHDGTPMAYLAIGEARWQMQPGSDFLNDLNSGDTTPGGGTDYTSIYTYADEIVPWWRSRPDGWNNIGGWYHMHITMMRHHHVHNLVENNLSQ